MKSNKITRYEVGKFYLYNHNKEFLGEINFVEGQDEHEYYEGHVVYYNDKYKIGFHLLKNGFIVEEILGVERNLGLGERK